MYNIVYVCMYFIVSIYLPMYVCMSVYIYQSIYLCTIHMSVRIFGFMNKRIYVGTRV